MIKTFQMLSVSKICISQTINIIYLYLMKEKTKAFTMYVDVCPYLQLFELPPTLLR